MKSELKRQGKLKSKKKMKTENVYYPSRLFPVGFHSDFKVSFGHWDHCGQRKKEELVYLMRPGPFGGGAMGLFPLSHPVANQSFALLENVPARHFLASVFSFPPVGSHNRHGPKPKKKKKIKTNTSIEKKKAESPYLLKRKRPFLSKYLCLDRATPVAVFFCV